MSIDPYRENEINDIPPQCSNCNVPMKKEKRDSPLYNYFKCPTCSKSLRKRKNLTTDEILFIMTEKIDKIKMEISCIVCLVIVWFILSLIITLYVNP